MRSLKALTTAILIDIACSEAAEYIVTNGMLSFAERRTLFATIMKSSSTAETANNSNADLNRQWILSFYEYLLLDQDPSAMENQTTSSDSLSDEGDNVAYQMSSAVWLVRQAEFNFNHQYVEDAYRLARHAYTIDPFDNRGLIIYIASMVELKLKTELFYLGHELVNSYPKMALSWYCVGCYYWCCNKQEFAQKYIVKATKMDKKFAKAWVMLGHVLSAQEESEQAISSYRTAIRLLPGDHRPMVYMAKELVRTHFLSLAQHILIGALELCPRDPGVLNELGVVYMKQDKLNMAVEHFELAVSVLDQASEATQVPNNSSKSSGSTRNKTSFSFKKSCGIEIYNNYATALRKSERFEEALLWYDKCLSANPRDASIFASKGFTLHLLRRLDEAINCYHQALALQPKLAFCSEMVNRAMEDMVQFDFSVDSSFMPSSSPPEDYLTSAGVVNYEKATVVSGKSMNVVGSDGVFAEGGGYEERANDSGAVLESMGLFSP
eukprot:CAMPEP_0170057838 /NCGR_PEP_ID=MMETSP0019_2-20121128/689_1 /TAXON_ID=98059 /ORGANISM="Dinobryon sp., Strain UTEXLB2267" /LENGTH=494 /DNA_ID=CAMNT_0010262635 /DNA_START=1481 /DNA_END=2965 /DNA_ORIENTATION=+